MSQNSAFGISVRFGFASLKSELHYNVMCHCIILLLLFSIALKYHFFRTTFTKIHWHCIKINDQYLNKDKLQCSTAPYQAHLKRWQKGENAVKSQFFFFPKSQKRLIVYTAHERAVHSGCFHCISPFFFKLCICLISLAETRRRDWSVAATRATRETKKWLALSPRRHRRDCRDWSVAATRETKTWLALSRRGARRGDVSETCWRLKKSPKKSNMFEFPATPRRPG